MKEEELLKDVDIKDAFIRVEKYLDMYIKNVNVNKKADIKNSNRIIKEV